MRLPATLPRREAFRPVPEAIVRRAVSPALQDGDLKLGAVGQAEHQSGVVAHHARVAEGADVYTATGKKEREANFFSADFLIPDEDVIENMRACDANFFNVARALCIPAPFFAFKLYSMVERGYAVRMPVDLNATFLAKE